MVQRIGATRPHRIFLTEHMAKLGVSDQRLADRLDVSRETVTRWRKYWNRLNPNKLAEIAAALDIAPQELWQHPDRPSVDALLRDEPDDVVKQIAAALSVTRKTGT